MRKEITKEDFAEEAEELVTSIRIARAIMNEQYPGSGDMMIEAVMEKLQELAPQKTDPVGNDRNNAAYDELRQGVCACGGAVGMTFGDALEALKKGCYVARKGWNGKNQYVMLATCISYKGSTGEIVNCHHNAIGNKALAFVGTSGVQMGWLASQADMLAEDWYIV